MGDGISLIGDIVLVKAIIATIRQECRDTFSFGIKFGYIKLHTLVYQTIFSILMRQDMGDGGVLNHISDAIHEIRFTWLQDILHINLTSFLCRTDLHLCIQESLVLQLLGQVGTGLHGTQAIIYNRCLAHRLQRAINPFRTVSARQGIDGKGKLVEREPSAIGHLPDIIA